MRLTNAQKIHLEDLNRDGKLYVGHNSPDIMRSFKCLVKKGLAQIVKEYPGYGIDFVATEL
jgi:hypothetical protein